MRQLHVYLRLGLAIALLYTGWVFLNRYTNPLRRPNAVDEDRAAREAEWQRTYGGSAVKILQFYSRDAAVVEGNNSVICYGVVNAKSVRIDPPVEGVSPALNRCVEIAPRRDTRYTLTAQGGDGLTVSESFVLGVSPDPGTIPRITSFRVSGGKPDYAGKLVFLMEFSQQNGAEVSIDPPVFRTLHGAPNGRFYVKPEKTTVYTLTVTGKTGHRVQQQLQVDVPQL